MSKKSRRERQQATAVRKSRGFYLVEIALYSVVTARKCASSLISSLNSPKLTTFIFPNGGDCAGIIEGLSIHAGLVERNLSKSKNRIAILCRRRPRCLRVHGEYRSITP